jgi:hypothetical protein
MDDLHIQRADDAASAFVQNMGINHGGIHIFMP